MTIPARYAPILFGAMLSAIMVGLVSAGNPSRIHSAVVQKLRDDVAGGVPHGDPRGTLGAQSRRTDDALTAFTPKKMGSDPLALGVSIRRCLQLLGNAKAPNKEFVDFEPTDPGAAD